MTPSPREIALRTARAAGLFSWMRRRHRRDLLVLTYHSVVKDVDDARQRHPLVYRNAVSATHFERQMRYLRRHYHPLDGSALRAALRDGTFPPRAVVVTFDDGLRNNATVALPILKALDVPAFFFLPTGFVDAASEGTLRRQWSEDLIARLSYHRRKNRSLKRVIAPHLPGLQAPLDGRSETVIRHVVDHLKDLPHDARRERLAALTDALGPPPPAAAFPAAPDGPSILETMTWEQARAAAADGITLGGHTVNHERLAALPDDQAAEEIETSLATIAEETDQAADFFSYPYGRPQDFSSFHQSVLANLGCRAAFTQIVGFNDASTPPLALRRIDASADHSLAMFAYIASGTKAAVDRVVRGRTPPSTP